MRARSRVSWLVLLVSAIFASWATRVIASHHVFSSSVDRFEADGNNYGPFDGTPDFVDEFNNGTLVPDWTPLLGTAVESGGVVMLKNPGTDLVIGTAVFDVSNIENEETIANGAGDLTATSYWVPTIPNTDTQFHFQLYAIAPIIESAGLSFSNWSVATAAQQQPPGIAGPAITQALTQIIYPVSSMTLQSNTVAINPGDITGQIVLRLAVNDATNTLTSSFSLDGGSTFQSPFPPMPVFVGVSDYEVLLGAGSVTSTGPLPTSTPAATFTPAPTRTPTPTPTPQTVGMKLLLVKNPSGATARKIVLSTKEFGHTVVGNALANGGTLRIKVDATSQCFSMPAVGWTPTAGGFKYSDTRGIYGPVKVARIKKSGSGSFQIKAVILGKLGPVNIVPPNPGMQADTNFSLGGGAQYCSSSATGAIHPNDAKAFKVKAAAAPPGCTLSPCP